MRRILPILLVSAALQLVVASYRDTMGDLLQYRVWMRTLASEGLIGAYWPAGQAPEFVIDYPPVIPYILLAVGRAVAFMQPTLLEGQSAALDFLIRLPFIVCNVVLSLLIFVAVRKRAAEGAALAAASVFAFNPAIIFHTAYWGQSDALWAVLTVAALMLLRSGRPALAWVAVTVAVLAKPLAAPFMPLIAIATVARYGWKSAVRGVAASAMTVLILVAPFISGGVFRRFVDTAVTDIDAMPYISVNAHNLWWIVGEGLPWTIADDKVLGLVSYKVLGLVLFGGWFMICLRVLFRQDRQASLELAAASVAVGFFMLSTHMHENHLFAFVPLLLLARGEHAGWRRFGLLVSVVFLANMVLHDPYLMYQLKPYTIGPRLLLHARAVAEMDRSDYFAQIGYPQLVEEMRGEKSLLWVTLTLLNAQGALMLFAYWTASLVVPGSTANRMPRLSPLVASGCLVLVVVTAVPFLQRAAQAPRWPARYRSIHVRDLPPPTPVSEEYGVRDVQALFGGDLAAHPPSGATFWLPTNRSDLWVYFTPSFNMKVPPTQTDGVTFEVWTGSTRLYSRHVLPTDRLSSVSLAVPGMPETTVVPVSLVTSAGPRGDRDFDWAIWHDVLFVVADQPAAAR